MTETITYNAIKNYYVKECGIAQSAAERLANYAFNSIKASRLDGETAWIVIRGIRNAFFDGERFA